MRTIEIQLFTFPELSDKAKERAIEAYRYTIDFSWMDESRESIEAFCDAFGVKLRDWSVGAYEPFSFSTDASPQHFRGRKLREFNRDAMPTGYCLDSYLWVTFCDEFKKYGDALAAFNEALHEGFKAWRDDMEFQLSDESISEALDCGGYEFTEAGLMN